MSAGTGATPSSSGNLTRSSLFSILRSNSTWFAARKGGLPVAISKMTAPMDQRSAFASYL